MLRNLRWDFLRQFVLFFFDLYIQILRSVSFDSLFFLDQKFNISGIQVTVLEFI